MNVVLSNSEYACLHAFGAAALYVVDPPAVNAAADPRNARAPIVWLAWARSLAEAECVRDRVRCGAGPALAAADLIVSVEQACCETGIVLAPHAVVAEGLRTRMARIEALFDGARRTGELAWFNQVYRAHRLACRKAGQHVLTYPCALRRLKLMLLTRPRGGAIPAQDLRQLFSTPPVTFEEPLQPTSNAHAIGTTMASGRVGKSHWKIGAQPVPVDET